MYKKVKRVLDVAFVLCTAWLWVPLMLGTMLAVLVFDGRPVFFRQLRAGMGGKAFEVLKFRTMIARDGGEPQATRLGRWLRKLSLDEVPQMVNVLKGDMSIVGPRPLPVAYLPRYSPVQARQKSATCSKGCSELHPMEPRSVQTCLVQPCKAGST